jgi:hypothetical protein
VSDRVALSSSPLFDRLRHERDDFTAFFESKVTAVAGGVTSPMLGLSDGDLHIFLRLGPDYNPLGRVRQVRRPAGRCRACQQRSACPTLFTRVHVRTGACTHLRRLSA